MRHNRIIFFACLAVWALPLAHSQDAQAQMNNRPFSFNTPGGGVGMSAGGQQAILNKEILGVTPDNMVRSPSGSLLSVSKAEDGSAIVSFEGGSFIPSFRGSSFRGGNESWAAGVFNSFFETNSRDSGISSYARFQTGAAISTWTGRVSSGTSVSFMPESPVDVWTGMVVQAAY
jgi:hypothetical protein